MKDVKTDIKKIAKLAKASSIKLSALNAECKNNALLNIAKKLEANKEKIFSANQADLKAADGHVAKSIFSRLKLDENKFRDMVQGIYDVVKLDNPVNKIFWEKELDKGLVLTKISCPIGVLGVIFEARPDVMVQISALAIKSSNCVILKGGKESNNINKVLSDLINEALNASENIPENVVNVVFSRDDVNEMLSLDKYIDLIIPRGSNKLVKFIKENTKIPVLGHASGICHIYLDEFADYNKALKIITDSKTQYPSACNSVETLLINKNFKDIEKLKTDIKNAGIEIIENPDNWQTEYGDTVLSLKIVKNLNEATEHINSFGSGHTDCIITENTETAEIFMASVDSAGVFHNASTRFSDGFRYGFGAEVGISTNKIHARGPVGLEGLTIYKYKLQGTGQIVDDYSKGIKKFTHKFI